MGPSFFLALTALSFAVAAPLVPRACAAGAHIIVIRGSTETGEGILAPVVTSIEAQIDGSDDISVDYPATLIPYVSSEENGISTLTADIKSYVASCPSAKIVLLGYSQGAQAMLDTLCGTSEIGWATTSALGSIYTKNIIAAIGMGDPSHVKNQWYDVGTSTKNGIFPRQSPAACSAHASVIQSYCDADDLFCDSGSSLTVHGSYVDKYASEMVSYVVDKYNAS